MGREVAVLSKLAPVYRARRGVLAYCDDRDVLGAPFYLMERRRGVILRKELPAGARRRRAVAPRSASCSSTRSSSCTRSTTPPPGLGDFGKPAGYIERQVTRLDRALRRLADRRHPGDDRGRRVARRAHARPTARRR